MKITGVAYWRKKRHISAAELSALTGVCVAMIYRMGKGYKPSITANIFIKLADALETTVDDLLEEYDDESLSAGDRVPYRWKNKPLTIKNCIADYRHDGNYSLQQLGDMLGVTRERARTICDADHPPAKHVATLAQLEGISVEEFHMRHDPEGRCDA